jgi:uncharacterized protein YqhQ
MLKIKGAEKPYFVFKLSCRTKKGDWKEWHTCEHKAANLLDSGEKITMENLSKSSRINYHCGSVFLMDAINSSLIFLCVFLILRPTAVNALFQIFQKIGKLPHFAAVPLYFFSRILLVALAVEFAVLMLKIFLGLSGFTAKIITPTAYFTQRFLFTAKPSKEKLKETFALLKKIETDFKIKGLNS